VTQHSHLLVVDEPQTYDEIIQFWRRLDEPLTVDERLERRRRGTPRIVVVARCAFAAFMTTLVVCLPPALRAVGG
jgi:hypothetical protein